MGTTSTPETETAIRNLSIPLERDVFFRSLIRALSGTLQEVVGLDEAAGFLSIVGQRLGDQINALYRSALAVERLSPPQVAEVIVDLERRLGGDFSVIEQGDEKIVLGNRTCPFGEQVIDRPVMCMITSNIIGVIAAENLGYARVVLEETNARGASGCHVIVYLKPTPEAEATQGREFFQG